MVSTTLDQLKRALAAHSKPQRRREVLRSGIDALDCMLPEGGFSKGGLVEWLAEPGIGATTLASYVLPSLLSSGKSWCVIDSEGSFVGGGLSSEAHRERCLVVRPDSAENTWWAAEQTLRCSGIALTWIWADQVPDRVLQRWQVAAQAGGGIGAVFRHPDANRRRSWADLRLSVVPLPSQGRSGRRLQVNVLYCRGLMAGQSVTLELHDATHSVCVVPELAGATASRRTAKVS